MLSRRISPALAFAIILVVALLFSAAAVSATPARPAPAPERAREPILDDPAERNPVDEMLAECREEAQRAYAENDQARMDRLGARLLADPVRNRDRIIACAAYIRGIMDTSQGRFPSQ